MHVKFRDFFPKTNVCLEISMFFYMFVYSLSDLTDTNLMIQKSCRLNTTSEPDLSTPCDDAEAGISFVTKLNSSYRFLISFSAIVVTIFLSGWSDEAGRNRKRIMTYVYSGQIVQLALMCLQSYFWHWSPYMAVGAEIIGQTLFVGNIGYRAFATLTLCDLTSHADRTVRLIALHAVDFAANPISSAVSGYLMHGIGFFWTYAVCTALSSVGLCCLYFVEDVSKPSEQNAALWTAISLRRTVNSFKMVFAKKSLKQRLLIPVLFMITLIGYFAYKGELTVLYVYLMYRFKWEERQCGVYLSYKLTGCIIGMMLTSLILHRWFKVHDSIIGMTAAFWDTIAAIAYLLAYENWQFYLIPVLDIFHGVALSVGQSLASQCFNSDQLGQFFSVNLVFCLLVPASVPAYNTIFELNKHTFPQAIFLLSIPLNLVICFLYGISYYLLVKTNNERDTQTSKP